MGWVGLGWVGCLGQSRFGFEIVARPQPRVGLLLHSIATLGGDAFSCVSSLFAEPIYQHQYMRNIYAIDFMSSHVKKQKIMNH